MNSRIVFFLLKLKNAAIYKKEVVTVDFQQDYIPILKVLYEEGYIQTFFIAKDNLKNKPVIKVYLRYLYNIFALSNLKLLSKQSCVRRITYKQISFNIYDIRKTFFITTNKGLKTQLGCKINQLGGSLFFMC
jgi:ribosomal protein S8